MTPSIYNSSIRRLFYIYVGPWRDNAAGIKVLHYLCNVLNETGNESYLVLNGGKRDQIAVNPHLNTPVLTKRQASLHRMQNRQPRVIYSETISGNPLNANCVVRYFLNFPGILGGSLEFPDVEMKVAYSQNIADSIDNPQGVLFLPAVDTDEIEQCKNKKGDYSLYYAGKYRAYVGKPFLPTDIQFEELPRINGKSTNRMDVLELIKGAKVLLVFENTTLATEAILLGTPVVFMPNNFLGKIIAAQELGDEGSCIGYTENGLTYAIDTLEIAKVKYGHAVQNFWSQLSDFLVNSDDFFARKQSLSSSNIRVPNLRASNALHKARLFSAATRNLGLSRAIAIALNLNFRFIRRKN